MKTEEEIFRIKGKEVAVFLEKSFASLGKISLVKLHTFLLNKSELQELINWLISKLDEME